MSNNASSADIARSVAEVCGVRGIEPSISSTIQTLGARYGGNDDAARFGIIVDEDGAGVTVEVGLEHSRPVKEIVRDIQAAVTGILSPASDHIEEDALDSPSPPSPPVHIRVQSLS